MFAERNAIGFWGPSNARRRITREGGALFAQRGTRLQTLPLRSTVLHACHWGGRGDVMWCAPTPLHVIEGGDLM